MLLNYYLLNLNSSVAHRRLHNVNALQELAALCAVYSVELRIYYTCVVAVSDIVDAAAGTVVVKFESAEDGPVITYKHVFLRTDSEDAVSVALNLCCNKVVCVVGNILLTYS